MKIRKTLNINVLNSNLTEKQGLKEQTILNGRKVRGIIATTFVGNGAMTASFLQACTITLRDRSNQVVLDALPLYVLDPKINANGEIQELDFEKEIDWNQSFVSNPNFATTGGTIIPITVIYE